MKRILVSMLSVVLVIGMLPGMAFAQGTRSTPVAENTETGSQADTGSCRK